MRNIFFGLITLYIGLSSCKRSNLNVTDGIIGPEIKAASSNFYILDTLKANYFTGKKIAKKDTVSFQYIQEIRHDTTINNVLLKNYVLDKTNFYKRYVFFSVKFSEEVSWKLTFSKLVNGERSSSITNTILGTSSSLDSTNTSWDGQAGENLFAADDKVVVELSFVQGTSITLTDTILISNGQYYTPSIAKLLNDFENGYLNTYTYNDNLDINPSPLPAIDKSISTPQGSGSMKVYGTDNNGDYFVGGFNIQKLDVNTMKNYPPDQIYLNMYVYGYPIDNALGISLKSTKLNIGFSEDDNLDGNFDGLTEDTYQEQVNVEWVGWKLITVRYNDLVRSNSKVNGGSGNGIFEPWKAYSANCNLISSPNGATVGANIDYVIITYGKPFDPSDL